MQVFSREAFPNFSWKDLDGKHGTIRISRDGGNELVAFHEDNGGLFVLDCIEQQKYRTMAEMLSDLPTEKQDGQQ